VGQSAVFASANDGPFEWVGNALGGEFKVATPETGTYRFYSLAIDKVGNAESVRPQPSTVEVTHVGVEEIEPFTFALRPSYPNPFSESAIITYSVDESATATVAVYDVLGRRVKILEERTHEPGEHRVILDADGLANGLYFVRLGQGKKSATISVVLLN
jgi:hypothetical protein